MAHEVHLHRPGIIAYHDARHWQQQTAAAVRNGAPEALAILQHSPVYTLGRRARPENILLDLETLAQRGAEVVETDRGGDVTFHGPGQLVAYPILNLRARNLGAADYVRLLEETMLRTAQRFGIAAERIPGRPGIWTVQRLAHATSSVVARSRSDEATSALRPTPPRPPIGSATSQLTPVLAKLGALGVRVHGGVSTHGLALNVDADLSCFDAIVPCGLPGVTVTSLERLLGYSPGLHAVENALIDAFEHVFESNAIASHNPPARNEAAGFILQSPSPLHASCQSGPQSPLSSQGEGVGGEVSPVLAPSASCAPLARAWGCPPAFNANGGEVTPVLNTSPHARLQQASGVSPGFQHKSEVSMPAAASLTQCEPERASARRSNLRTTPAGEAAGFILQDRYRHQPPEASHPQSPLSSQGEGVGGEVTHTLATNAPCAPLAGDWGQSPHVRYQAHAR